MLQVDEFESVFRSAAKTPFKLDLPEVEHVTLVCDLDMSERAGFVDACKLWLSVLPDAAWSVVSGADLESIESMMSQVRAQAPDLIVSYRNLNDDGWKYNHSLGAFFNVLTRDIEVPMLSVPNPNVASPDTWKGNGTDSVMVVTNHLVGDDSLINWGLRLCEPNATLHLTHLEDDAVLERYIDAIGKIPTLDTDEARETISKQLLKEPYDYMVSCERAVAGTDLPVTIDKIVRTGHRIETYADLIAENEVDLLAFHAQDDGAVAMHGTAYNLMLNTGQLPLLIL